MSLIDNRIGRGILIFTAIFCMSLFGYLYYVYGYSRYDVEVIFPNLGNLSIDDAVKIRGTQVGCVKSISLIDNKPHVILQMYKHIKLKEDYKINEHDKGLMGDREIEIVLGENGTDADISKPLYGNFVSGIAENMAKANNLKGAMNDLNSIVHEFAVGSENKKSFPVQFNEIIGGLDMQTTKINKFAGDIRRPLKNTVDKVNKVSLETRKLAYTITKSSDTLLNNIDSMVAIADSVIAPAEALIDTLGKLTDRLLTDSIFIATLFRPASSLDTIAANIEKLQRELDLIRRKGHLNINLF